MPWYDLVMIAVLVGTTLIGAWKGLAWQLASLASLVVSYFVALRFSGPLAPYLAESVPWNRFLAMLLIYTACSAAIWLLFQLVAGFIDRLRLQEFDHQMGGVAGAAKGVLLCTAITIFAVGLVEDPYRAAIVQSRSGRFIARLLDRTHNVIPAEVHDVLHPYLHSLDERLEAGRSHHHDTVPAAIPDATGP